MGTGVRRRAAVAIWATLLVVIGGSHLALGYERQDARASTAVHDRARSALAASSERLEREHAQASADQRALAIEVDAARGRLDELSAAERAELDALLARQDEHRQVEAALEDLRRELEAATDRSQRNDELLAALHRCLDGATRAGNALSVGDTGRALRALDEVRSPCEAVTAAVAT